MFIIIIVDRQDMMRIAAEANVDVRTVIAFMTGVPVRPQLKQRIETAIRVLDLEASPPQTQVRSDSHPTKPRA